jgi:hypothetical protein
LKRHAKPERAAEPPGLSSAVARAFHLAHLLLPVRGSVRGPFVGIDKQSGFLLTAERIGV